MAHEIVTMTFDQAERLLRERLVTELKDQTWTVKQLADHWQVCTATVRKWIQSGDLVAVELSKDKLLRVLPEAKEAFEQQRSTINARGVGAPRATSKPSITERI